MSKRVFQYNRYNHKMLYNQTQLKTISQHFLTANFTMYTDHETHDSIGN